MDEKGSDASELLMIPDEFALYADALWATERKKIHINLKEETILTPWQSKVGGHPFLPLTEKIPCNSQGQNLIFLAQINFSEIPHLDGYPEKGILEFYIDGTDEFMGLNYKNMQDQNGFRVLYFGSIEDDESKLHKSEDLQCSRNITEYGPLEDSCSFSMEFTLKNQFITAEDYRFNSMPFADDDGLCDKYFEVFGCGGHSIGGYPYFNQGDPREDNESFKDFELLFQLDSEEKIQWGDSGVGGFLIHPDDLKKLDFSRVLYNWDST